MRFLHIIIPSKRMMNTYVRMIREHFELEEHHFLFYEECKGEDRELLEYKNVFELTGTKTKKVIDLYSLSQKYDFIIWHGLMFNTKRILPLYINPFLRRKSVWIIRGIDLYNWKLKTKSLKNLIINHINYSVRKRIPYAIAIFETDSEVYKKQFKKAIYSVVPYPLSKEAFEEMDRFDAEKERKNRVKFFLIGNSGYSYNNHLEALDFISGFRDEKIRAFIPLSYGNALDGAPSDYLSLVKKKSYDFFGEKAEILTKLMPPEDYNKLLFNIDIAIINSVRQNALGNILRLLYVGNHIYFNPDNPMYSFFIEEGINVHDINELSELNFSDLPIAKRDERICDWIRERHHPDYQYKKWKEFFEKISCKSINEKIFKSDACEMPHEKSHKVNYLCLERWKTLEKGSKLDIIEDVYVIGDGVYEYTVTKWINFQNQIFKRWFVNGIISEKELVKSDEGIYQDIVGDFSDLCNFSGKFILSIKDSNKRKKFVDSQEGKGLSWANYYDDYKYSFHRGIGEGTIIGPETVIDPSAQIGKFCFVFGANVGMNCKIDDFCNIEGSSCKIYSDVKVGSNTVIRNAIISSNVVVGDNCIIEDDSFIGQNAVIGNNVRIKTGAYVGENMTVIDNEIIYIKRDFNVFREENFAFGN